MNKANPRNAGRKLLPDDKKSKAILVSLTANLKEFVENEIENNGYSSPAEYIRELIRKEMNKK